MSSDDHVEVICPYCDDGTKITAHVDTIGDPSVGMQPDGVWRLDGPCIHVAAINDDLEDDEQLRKRWPSFMKAVDDEYQKMAAEEYELERMLEEKHAEAERWYEEEQEARNRIDYPGDNR